VDLNPLDPLLPLWYITDMANRAGNRVGASVKLDAQLWDEFCVYVNMLSWRRYITRTSIIEMLISDWMDAQKDGIEGDLFESWVEKVHSAQTKRRERAEWIKGAAREARQSELDRWREGQDDSGVCPGADEEEA